MNGQGYPGFALGGELSRMLADHGGSYPAMVSSEYEELLSTFKGMAKADVFDPLMSAFLIETFKRLDKTNTRLRSMETNYVLPITVVEKLGNWLAENSDDFDYSDGGIDYRTEDSWDEYYIDDI